MLHIYRIRQSGTGTGTPSRLRLTSGIGAFRRWGRRVWLDCRGDRVAVAGTAVGRGRGGEWPVSIRLG